MTSSTREDERLGWISSTGALITGDHIALYSGRHSAEYVSKDLVSTSPMILDWLSLGIANHFRGGDVQVVAAPAVGAIALGNRVANHIGSHVKAVFAEEKDGKFVFGRGFARFIKPGVRVLVVEDIITTGKTARGMIEAVRELGGKVGGIGLLWNRSTEEFEVPVFACVNKVFPTYAAEECPLCKERKPINTWVNKHGQEFLDKYGTDPAGWPANEKVRWFAEIETRLNVLKASLSKPALKEQEVAGLLASLRTFWTFARGTDQRYFSDIVSLMYDGLRNIKVEAVEEVQLEGFQICLDFLKSRPEPTVDDAAVADGILTGHGLETITP